MNDLDLYKNIRNAILPLFDNVEIIKANQNAPEPEDAYISINLLDVTPLTEYSNKKVISEDGLDIDFTGQQLVSRVISFKAFKQNACDIINKLRIGIKRPNINSNLSLNGIGITNVGTVRNLTYILTGGYEEKYQIDMVINYVDEDLYTIERIKTVEGTGTLVSGNTTINTTFNTQEGE